MTTKANFGTAFLPRALTCAVLAFAPMTATAATLSLDGFEGDHFHNGGNVGLAYAQTTDAQRTTPIPMTPGGLAFQSTYDVYSGEIPSVASLRLGQGEAAADTVGLVDSDGFFFAGSVESVATCTFKDKLSGCIPFMRSEASAKLTFSVDEASTLYLDGFWQGGNGTESLVSVVDFFGLSVREIRPVGGALNIYNVDTNIFNRNEANGVFDGQIALKAGATYEFAFSQSAYSQSPDASGASDSDAGSFAFSASFFETNNVAYYQAAANAAMNIAPVPLPAGGLLLMFGLGALGAVRRFSDRRSA